MLYSICYDIKDDRRRNRIFKLLKDFGEPVQFSVFEADIESEQLDRLLKRAEKLLDQAEDNLRIYPICAACRTKIEIIGQGKVIQDPEFIII